MSKSSPARGAAPRPPGALIVGHAPAFRRDPLGFLLATAERCGPIARLQLGPLTYHLVSDPALVAEVLQTRSGNYIRDTRSSRTVRLVTGESLLTAEGDLWRRHRRLAQPMFHQRRIAALAQVMARVADTAAPRWERAAREGRPLDLAQEMSRLTFSVVGHCLFGAELEPHLQKVETALPVLLEELAQRTQQVFALPLWLPLARHRRFREALNAVDSVVARIITTRRGQPASDLDLLGMLLAARDEDGSALSDAELRSQVITFLLAGHETTASTLTWAFALLAQHADEDTRVAAELASAGARDGTIALIGALPAMLRVNAVLAETLRLYPAIWIAERQVVAADELGGFQLPAGSAVIVAPYVTHRLANLWPEPNAFSPNRFMTGTARTLIDDGYFPFGAGPHACIGQHFALMEAKIILATLAARFRLHLVDGKLPVAAGGITLRPAEPMPVRVELRGP